MAVARPARSPSTISGPAMPGGKTIAAPTASGNNMPTRKGYE